MGKINGQRIGCIIDRLKLAVDMWRLRDPQSEVSMNGADASDLLEYIDRVHDELLSSRQYLTGHGLHRYANHTNGEMSRIEAMEAKNETLIYSLVRMGDDELATRKAGE